MVKPPKRVGVGPGPETGQLLEEEGDASLLAEISHSPGPIYVHFSSTGLTELRTPICFGVPNVLRARPTLAPHDYPPKSGQVEAACNVFKKRLSRKESHCFGMHRNLTQRVHFVERLRASGTDTQPDVCPSIAPIFG